MGSQAQIEVSTPADSGMEGKTTAVLRLWGAPEPRVDNECLGRKSSKGMLIAIMTPFELHSRALGLL